MIDRIKNSVFIEIQNLVSSIKLSRTPATIRSVAPKLEENTEEILESLNYSEGDIRNFKKNSIKLFLNSILLFSQALGMDFLLVSRVMY
jgi:crotonobetainyl-CoA:carnitine CoA-transferase CaiB-like acyl-CoA transferase